MKKLAIYGLTVSLLLFGIVNCKVVPEELSPELKQKLSGLTPSASTAASPSPTSSSTAAASKDTSSSSTPVSPGANTTPTTTLPSSETSTPPASTAPVTAPTSTNPQDLLSSVSSSIPGGATSLINSILGGGGACQVSVLQCAIDQTPEPSKSQLKTQYDPFIADPAKAGCAQAVTGASISFPQCKK